MNNLFPSVQQKIKSFIENNEKNNTPVDVINICTYMGLEPKVTLKNLHILLDNGDVRHKTYGMSSKYLTKL